MRSARFSMALAEGLVDLPATGRIGVFRPRAGDDLTTFPAERLVVLTGFRPDYDHFRSLGYATETSGPLSAAIVCLPRSKAHAQALLAQAAAATSSGGPVIVDGQKTDGIDALLKLLKTRVELSGPLAKAHGKIAAFPAGPELADWAVPPRQIGGFVTCPGAFSADGPDRGSEFLAQALPASLGPMVVDLGAGWGFLSRAILERDGVERLDLVEAEAGALDCARLNIRDERARFHWADACRFRPDRPVDAVVMNPPFHHGRTAEPELGLAFIRAARGMLAREGALWMVANQHLPYLPALSQNFHSVEILGDDNVFRIVRAAKPRRG